ncbi:hypothetical protein PsorP6_008406 [Peronosclerospora sorghi]|uniref:Uncharacterized protein n=1 Tax=Peronosclerospora sorghi TaxID=230839 RepID=A0ACC0WD17_9STRA|nr:hypothetical protein PsorP6_008406 [Peronosclerospora sorghi]
MRSSHWLCSTKLRSKSSYLPVGAVCAMHRNSRQCLYDDEYSRRGLVRLLLLSILFSCYLFGSCQLTTSRVGVLIWLSLGMVIYLGYGIRHSVLIDQALLRPLI